MPRESYAKWDYDQFNETGLEPLVKALKRHKIGVIGVEGSNKPTRASGVQTKKALIILRNGQTIMLQVTAQGAVFQVRLNNRVVPLRAKGDITSIAKELAAMVRKNQPKFDEKLAKLAEKQEKTTSTPRKRALTVRKRLEDLTASIAPLLARKEELVEKETAARLNLEDAMYSKRSSDTSLRNIQANNDSLYSQIDALEDTL